MTELLTPKDVTKAVALLQAGQLVALPTETVYGLFGLALDNTVVEKVYQVKNRQHDHALNLNISSFEQMKYFRTRQRFYIPRSLGHTSAPPAGLISWCS